MENWVKKEKVLLYQGGPHDDVDFYKTHGNKSWQKGVLSAQWPSNFDCDIQMPWWYCILDHTISLESMKSSKRYDIKRGQKNFSVKKIDASEYSSELARITLDEWKIYDSNYKPSRNEKSLAQIYVNHSKNPNEDFWGCFNNETGELQGFAQCMVHDEWVNFSSLKVDAKAQREGASYAIVYAICEHYSPSQDGKIKFISDGQRNIVHDTNFQDFLVKKFSWRYAYTKLNIAYRPSFKILIKLAFPFRKVISKSKKPLLYKASIALQYEEISRECKKALKNG